MPLNSTRSESVCFLSASVSGATLAGKQIQEDFAVFLLSEDRFVNLLFNRELS